MSNGDDKKAWETFISQEQLSSRQVEQFKHYLLLLIEWNKKINLTAITAVPDIINYHFRDSLAVKHIVDLSGLSTITDIGTGAGFPGIPLKIMYPHVSVILIEVNNKKNAFLENVIKKLELENVDICPLDWRTFLRKTSYHIDLFLARASLHVDELVHMFKPSSVYRDSRLVYWASRQWKLEKREEPFFEKDVSYAIAHKKRRLVLFQRKSE